MIKLSLFDYSPQQLAVIGAVIRDELGRDADQITVQGVSGLSLLGDIEIAASFYRAQFFSRQRPHREELIALRRDAESMRARIAGSLAVHVVTTFDNDVQPLPLPDVDDDMLTSTDFYFPKLLRNLDRVIEQTGSRRDNARKPDRDHFWNQSLAIWCKLGGKPTGKAAASFLIAASKPVMGSAVPTLKSVVQWLERRQNKTAKPLPRRAAR